jgi:hypothetical protein
MRRTTSLLMGIRKAKAICCAIRGQPHVGFCCFMSRTAAMTSWVGRLLPDLGREQPAIFPRRQRAMEPQERRGFQDDRGTDQPALAHEERTHAGDDAICEAEIRCSFPGPIEDQQLLLEEHGFGGHRTPPGPASRAIIVSRWRRRTARSHTRASYQEGKYRKCS